MPARPICVHHGTSMPLHFFGRVAELALLDDAWSGHAASVLAFVGPGGQGKTALVQHWLEPFLTRARHADGVFLWSFYRGKDADVCLRELYAYAVGGSAGDVSASYCVDHLLPILRRERWVLILDGTEVAQHESGAWFGRFLHPELGRLLEELAQEPQPGVAILTSRFPLPELSHRKHARVIALGGLDAESARGLLTSLEVTGDDAELDEAAIACGMHAKAIELLATFLTRFHGGDVRNQRRLPNTSLSADACAEERQVARVLAAYQAALGQEEQDILALATAFREPPSEVRLLEYLVSDPVQNLLHDQWGRTYTPLRERADWTAARLAELVHLRLLERIPTAGAASAVGSVIDAHPLVRRWFAQVLGGTGRREGARARAGFLTGRPDRRHPATLEEAREEVELFHAHCDAGFWNEADRVLVALDNPKHRFLAPALERDLLLRFFPGGDWRQPTLWPGFGRYRSLAICFELLGQFEEAIAAYRDADAALRGDALLALGRLEPLLSQPHMPPPWDSLWQAYRAHALCLAGETRAAVALARKLVPQDVYEWIHLFECLLRTGELATLDLRSMLYRPPYQVEHRWSELARQRMRADYLRVQSHHQDEELGPLYVSLLESYDRGGLPLERVLSRLGYARWLLAHRRVEEASAVNAITLELVQRHRLPVFGMDAWNLAREIACMVGDATRETRAAAECAALREALGYTVPMRP